MVSVEEVVVGTAEVLAAAVAKLRGRLAATLLMLLQFFRAAESADVAHFYFLTSLDFRVHLRVQPGNEFNFRRLQCSCSSFSMSLGPMVGLRLRPSPSLLLGLQVRIVS